MSDTSERGPCGNEKSCDKCYPIPRWRVSKHRIQHLTYVREIKAATREEAMAIFEMGTAHPTQYDDEYGEIVQQDDAVIAELPPSEFHLTECCWHDVEQQASDGYFGPFQNPIALPGLVALTSCDFVGDMGCTDPDCAQCHPKPTAEGNPA